MISQHNLSAFFT